MSLPSWLPVIQDSVREAIPDPTAQVHPFVHLSLHPAFPSLYSALPEMRISLFTYLLSVSSTRA